MFLVLYFMCLLYIFGFYQISEYTFHVNRTILFYSLPYVGMAYVILIYIFLLCYFLLYYKVLYYNISSYILIYYIICLNILNDMLYFILL